MAAADGTAAAAAERNFARAARLRDLTPVMRVQAQAMQLESMNAFRNERSPAGDDWPKLAPSTVEQRIAKLPGANRRSKRSIAEKLGLVQGKLTKGAKRLRNEARLRAQGFATAGGGNIKILFDTGQLRNSIKYEPQPHAIIVEAAAHVLPHMDPADPAKKRNPLVIEANLAGDMRLYPKAEGRFVGAVDRFIIEGKL